MTKQANQKIEAAKVEPTTDQVTPVTAPVAEDPAPTADQALATVPAAENPAPTVFDQAVAFVLRAEIEGGYVDDPRDPGGETNFGISKRAHPNEDIKNLTRERAMTIYRRTYWDACKCDQLPPKVAVAMFDAAVNQGVGAATLLLQRALRVKADGIIGPVTLASARDADQDELLIELMGWRLHRYAFTANASTFMRGWANRVLRALLFAANDLREG